MKVCHITTAHAWDDPRIFIKQCRSLSNAGFDVHLIASCDEDFESNGVNFHAIGANRDISRLFRVFVKLWRAFNCANRVKADLFHLHDPELLLIADLLRLRLRCKVVYDSHEDLPRQVLGKHYIPRPFRKSLSIIVDLIEKWVSRRLTGVVAATPHIAKLFEGINGNLVVVQNFPILKEFIDLQPKVPIKPPYNVCYVGGLTQLRGVEQMIAAWSDNPDWNLIIAGPIGDDVSRNLIDKHSQSDRFEYLGNLPREGVIEVLSRSSVGLLVLHPNDNYLMSYPVKLFEYMAAGLPVVASDFPLWRTIIEAANCGICIDPFDIGSISNAVNELLKDPNRYDSITQNAKAAVRRDYDWNNEAKKLIEFYSQLKG